MELWQWLALLNAAFGILIFEWSWFRMRRFRKPNADLDALYPAYRRDDALTWKKWKLYPGAATILLPRLLFAILALCILMLVLNLLLLGHEPDTPITGLRKRLLTATYKVITHMIAFFSFSSVMTYSIMPAEDVDYYQDYLGTPEEQQKC